MNPPRGGDFTRTNVTKSGANIKLQANNDYIIFLGTLFLTSVLGIVSRLQNLEKAPTSMRKISLGLHGVLYFSLLAGITFSISHIFHILRENYVLISNDKLGEGLKDWLSQTTANTFYSGIQGGWGTFLVVGIAIGLVNSI